MFSSPEFAEECIRKQSRNTQFTVIIANYKFPDRLVGQLEEYGSVLVIKAQEVTPQGKPLTRDPSTSEDSP